MKKGKGGTYVQADPKDRQQPILRCDGCGYEERVRLPLSANQFCDIAVGFDRRHEECRKGRKRRT